MLSLTLTALALAPQVPTGPAVLRDPQTAAADGFGSAVAIDADLLVVGSREDVGNAFASYGPGAVTVFRRAGGVWSVEARLTASDGEDRDAFGAAVDVDATAGVVVVGAPRADGGGASGKAYVFERQPNGSWLERARLAGVPGRERYGAAVAVRGGICAIGQPDFTAEVHLVERGPAGAWSAAGALTRPATVFDSSEFGEALAMEGDLLVVGAPGEDAQSYDSGATYVFRRTGAGAAFAEEARLEHPSAFVVTYHGTDVDVDVTAGTERVAVGSQDDRAFVWTRLPGGWTDVAELAPFDGELGGFGETVALDGTVDGARVVVGATRRSGSSADSGAALEYVLDGGAWTPRSLVHPTVVADRGFASSLALSGDTLVVGSPRTDALGLDAGTALRYRIDLRLGTSHCAGRANSTGASAALTARGSTAVAANDLAFDVVGLPAGSVGYLLMATSRNQVPGLGGGDGDLCLGGTISRVLTALGTADALGTRAVTLDSGALPPSAVLIPGSTWSFQWWYRDANPSPTSNTTHAVELLFE
ncbi:MAG: hypothetical protein AAF726_11835 [Planctomycetota bacterium]